MRNVPGTGSEGPGGEMRLDSGGKREPSATMPGKEGFLRKNIQDLL